MAGIGDGWMSRAFSALALRRWSEAARKAETADLRQLRRQRAAARRLKDQLDRLIHVADGRLALPLLGNQSFPRPHDADWAWRPELWCGPLSMAGLSSVPSQSRLGGEVTLFHDCAQSEITLRQLRNTREADLAAYGGICLQRYPGGWRLLGPLLGRRAVGRPLVAGGRIFLSVYRTAAAGCDGTAPTEVLAVGLGDGAATAPRGRLLPLGEGLPREAAHDDLDLLAGSGGTASAVLHRQNAQFLYLLFWRDLLVDAD